jgi:hypothetical protein
MHHRTFSVLKPERFTVSGFPFGVLYLKRKSPEYRLLAVLLPESFLP